MPSTPTAAGQERDAERTTAPRERSRLRTYVLGGENCVLGFGLMGVDGRTVRDRGELEQALDACLADGTIGILLVSSDVAALARERVDGLKVGSLSPLVVEVPGQAEDVAYPSLREFVQRAVGVKLGGS
jgi:vacuolar-type H+-ATPase subunit F/Vma7